MMVECNIELSKSDKVYYTGEALNGAAYIDTTQLIEYSEISVKMIGESQTKFPYAKFEASGYRKFFDYKNILYNNGRLREGRSKVRFTVELPEQLPSSYEYEHGSIDYQVIFSITLADESVFTCEESVTIIKGLHTKTHPELLKPFIKHAHRDFFGCFGKHKFVELDIILDRCGYTIGSKINYEVRADNFARRVKIKSMSVDLISETFYFSTHRYPFPTMLARSLCCTLKQDFKVPALGDNIITGVLEIPNDLPSSHMKGIIRIRYYIRIVLHCNLFVRHLDIVLPITLGDGGFTDVRHKSSIIAKKTIAFL